MGWQIWATAFTVTMKRWIEPNRAADYRRFICQKTLIESYFPCFRCRLFNNLLTCKGEIIPSQDCDEYSIVIQYAFRKVPRVTIAKPTIRPSSQIHMYRCGALCLYDPRETPWLRSDNVHEKIIPWVAEWLVFYELFVICGTWLGPEAPHGLNGKFQQVRS